MNPPAKTWIGLDLGTSAIKGVLVDDTGGLLSRAKRAVALLRPRERFVEIDPAAHWEAVWELIRELAAQSPVPVAGLAMAAASGNTLLLNADGSPRTRIVSWLDSREDWCPPDDWQVHEIVGWPGLPAFPLAHLHWLRREQPAALHGALAGMNNDFLAWRLCGRRALDHSSATPFYLQDQLRRAYHEPYLAAFGLTERQLPELVSSGTRIGTLRAERTAPGLTADTAVYAGSFDHPAAARALDVTHPDVLLVSCGTSWVGFQPVPGRRIASGVLLDPFLSEAG